MLSSFLNLIWNLGFGKSKYVILISTRLLSPLPLDIMSIILCLLVLRMPLMNSRTLWMIFVIPSVISPLFKLMMSLSIPNPLMKIGNIYIHFLISSNIMVLLFLQRKSNYFKQRFVSLAMTFLKDKSVPLTETFNLLINFLMLSLIKPSSKDFLDH